MASTTMAGVHICRLCVNVCKDHKNLYDDKEVYEITVKYFDPAFLNFRNLTALCFECWCHIVDFYNFQQSVQLAQAKLGDSPDIINILQTKEYTNTYVKEEPKYMDDNPDNADDELILPELMFEVNEIAEAPQEYSNSNNSSDYQRPIGIATPMTLDQVPLVSTNKNTKEQPSPSRDVTDPLRKKSSNLQDQRLINLKKSLVAKILTKTSNTPPVSSNPIISEDNIKLEPFFDQEDFSSEPSAKAKSSREKRKRYIKELDILIANLKPALKCQLCFKHFPTFTLLQHHFIVDHPEEEFHVLCCHNKFKQRSRLEEHLRMHHDAPQPDFQCAACGKNFAMEKTLINHSRQCPRYKLKFGAYKAPPKPPINKRRRIKNKKARQVVVSTQSQSSRDTPSPVRMTRPTKAKRTSDIIECDQCGDYIETEKELRLHVIKFHTQRNYKCTLCVKAFTRSDGLREHMATHTGTPLYSCPHCPRTFIYSSSKSRHLKEEHPDKHQPQDHINQQPMSNVKSKRRR